ncbi:MAG: hypothetical protein CSA89_01005 [Bacteroidales bacterium]|nr:MAG: hypothetical protein CSA89_01005 [Bacteroidales bacterium]
MSLSDIHRMQVIKFVIGVVLVAVVSVLLFFTKSMLVVAPSQSVVDIVKTILLLYILISIPVSLKIVGVVMKKNSNFATLEVCVRKYTTVSAIRLCLLLFGLLGGVVCYILFYMQDMLYLIGIEVVALLFCLPTYGRVEQEMAIVGQNDNV